MAIWAQAKARSWTLTHNDKHPGLQAGKLKSVWHFQGKTTYFEQDDLDLTLTNN